MNTYSDDELLMLSGIQHMAFCERQWALIHIEQVWAENVRTVEGRHLHERTDDPFENETRNDLRIVRAMPIVSYKLGLRGIADVVEFQKCNKFIKGITIQLINRYGWWQPYPVEYKRGRPKTDDRDAVQLCAQAIALEEMMDVSINKGYLYYGQIKRRETIYFGETLRKRVEELSMKMHELFILGVTPKPSKGKHCSLCSLVEICQPNLIMRQKTVKNYLTKMTELEVKDY